MDSSFWKSCRLTACHINKNALLYKYFQIVLVRFAIITNHVLTFKEGLFPKKPFTNYL